jgi:AAA+ ATPase superfamily predicted ATPase
VVALNEVRKEVAFFEVKWHDLTLGEANQIITELKKKSEYVAWNKCERVEYFGLIAKRLAGKGELRAEGYLCYDFEDMQEA